MPRSIAARAVPGSCDAKISALPASLPNDLPKDVMCDHDGAWRRDASPGDDSEV